MVERTTPKIPIELAWDEYVASMEGRLHGQTDAFKFAWKAAKKEWVGLTGEDAMDVSRKEEQEPVAWRRREVGGGWQYYGWKETGMTYEAVNRSNKNGFECEAIPANPPQRPWVGLTEDERDHLAGLHLYAVKGQVEAWIEGVDDFAQAIEAKLKEKNT